MKNLFYKKKFTGTGHVLGAREPTPPDERSEERPNGSPLVDKFDSKNKKASNKTSLRDHLQGLDKERRDAPLQFCQDITADAPERIAEATSSEQNVADVEAELKLQISILLSHDEEDSLKSVNTLRRVLRNMIASPLETKYQTLNLTKTKVKESIVDVPGALEFLCLCGFLHEEEQVNYQGSSQMSLPKEGLELLNKHFPEKQKERALSAPPGKPLEREVIPRERCTTVVLPKPTETELPEWFFKRTTADIKAEYHSVQKKREQDETLMTRAQREKLKGSKPNFDFATIRIRLPEGILLQGEFNAVENVFSIHLWVSEHLRDPSRPFELLLPSREKLSMKGTVKSCQLMPATLLAFHWSDGMGMIVHEPTVTDETLMSAIID